MENKSRKPSIKHHYIPQFYLHGFADEEGMYYVHDKLTGNTVRSSPANTFFKKHLNTGSIIDQSTGQAENSDMPEMMLSHFDGNAGAVFKKVRASQASDDVLQLDVLNELMIFLHSLFWRSPANDELREHIIAQSSFEELGFGIFDKEHKRSFETEDIVKGINLFQKTYPVLLPMTSFLNGNFKKNWQDWKLYYHDKDMHVVSDNPVIYKEMTSFSSLQENVIFPISSKIFLISSPHYPETIDTYFPHMVDLYLFHTAKRFVACKNKLYLTFLEKQNATTVKEQGAEKLKYFLFKYIDETKSTDYGKSEK